MARMCDIAIEQSRRVLNKTEQQGPSEVHGAKSNERHGCGRRRVGEPAVSEGPTRTLGGTLRL